MEWRQATWGRRRSRPTSPRSTPATAAWCARRACRSSDRTETSFPQHALLVEVPELSLGVVARFERVVRGLVVEPPEILLGIIGIGIEGLHSAEVRNLALDLAVVVAGLAPHAVLHHVPESEVHVQRPGIDRIERESLLRIIAADRADPHRKDPDLLEEECEKLGRSCDGNIHVLDHGLRVFAPQS